MTTVSLRLDEKLKEELDEICEAMGLSLTALFTIYAKKVARERKIPFEIEAPSETDYFDAMLKRADCYAASDSTRLTHDEVFGGLRDKINERD